MMVKTYEIPSKDMIEFRDSRVYNQNPVNHGLDAAPSKMIQSI